MRRRARHGHALYGVSSGAKVSPRRRLDAARAGEGSARTKERESRWEGIVRTGKERGRESRGAPIPLLQAPHQDSMRFERG